MTPTERSTAARTPFWFAFGERRHQQSPVSSKNYVRFKRRFVPNFVFFRNYRIAPHCRVRITYRVELSFCETCRVEKICDLPCRNCKKISFEVSRAEIEWPRLTRGFALLSELSVIAPILQNRKVARCVELARFDLRDSIPIDFRDIR